MATFEENLSSRLSQQMEHDERGDCDHDCACPCHDKRVQEYECPDECACECHDEDDEHDEEEKPTGAEVYGHPAVSSFSKPIEPEHHDRHFLMMGAMFGLLLIAIGLAPQIYKRIEQLVTPKPAHKSQEVVQRQLDYSCTTNQMPVVSRSGELSCVDTAQIDVEHKQHSNVLVLRLRQGHAEFFVPDDKLGTQKMLLDKGDTLTATVK